MIIPAPKRLTSDDFHGDWKTDMPDVFKAINDLSSNNYSATTTRLDVINNLGWQVITIKSLSVPDPWQTPTLGAGWTNFEAASEQAGYMKDGFGLVTIRGLVTHAGTGTAFTLPVTHRPELKHHTATAVSTAGVEGHGRLRVGSDGTVDIAFGSPSTWGSIYTSFYCSDYSPYIPTCFPIKVISKLSTGQAGAVVVGTIRDLATNSSTKISGASVSWHNETGFSSNSNANSIVIDNITSLIPNHNYSVTLLALPMVK